MKKTRRLPEEAKKAFKRSPEGVRKKPVRLPEEAQMDSRRNSEGFQKKPGRLPARRLKSFQRKLYKVFSRKLERIPLGN